MGILDRLLSGGHGSSHGGSHGDGHGGGHDDQYRNDPPRPQDHAWGTSAGTQPPAAVAPTIACTACGTVNGPNRPFLPAMWEFFSAGEMYRMRYRDGGRDEVLR